MSDRPQRTNTYTATPVSARYRECLFDWLAAHAPLWNQLTYRRRQQYFDKDGDVWDAEYTDLYESKLGDDGVRLSGGQRQRVALARALLKAADFLVLDEATSDLDSSLERAVQDAIESMDREYGIIAIAHRLSTVKNADQIYTVDQGEIIEQGTHKELLADNGEYAELYAIQSQA